MDRDREQALGIEVGHAEGVSVVALVGELDVQGAPRLRSVVEGLAAAGHRQVVMDMSELTFCDARGLEAFVRLDHLLDALGGELEIREPRPPVRRVLEVTDLDHELHVTS